MCMALLGRAQTAQEWKLNLAPFGLVKAGCAWYPGDVEFLDDDHLIVSAPVAYTCGKSDRDKPIDTRITEIDLQGHEVAGSRKPDVVELVAAPLGYVGVCTGDRIELLSPNLEVARSIALPETGRAGRCFWSGGLSPSRTAMAIWGPAKSEIRLYQGSSADPIAADKHFRKDSLSVLLPIVDL